jgi:hypothetical protein
MKKVTFVFVLLFISSLSYPQNKSILICGFSAELGMDMNDFMDHISGNYSVKNVNSYTQNHEVYIIYEGKVDIGSVEFDENKKLVGVHKEWGTYSVVDGNDFFETLFSILEKYKNELVSCQILTDNIVEPSYKIKNILIRIPSRDFYLSLQNNVFSIEEHLY